MKTSTKIILILFVILSVASAIFSSYVFYGIIPSVSGFVFAFSTLGYVGIALMSLTTICGFILFVRFVKSQKLAGAIFFSVAPISLLFGGFVFYVSAVSNLNDVTSLSVKATLNMSGQNDVNKYLWIGLAFLVYMTVLYLILILLCKPLSSVQKVAQKLGDGMMKYENYKIGNGKQFKDIEHSLNKINYNYRARENKIKKFEIKREFLSKEMQAFFGKNGIFEIECGNQIKKNTCLLFLKLHQNTISKKEKSIFEKDKVFVSGCFDEMTVAASKLGGFSVKTLSDGILFAFPKAKNAVECSTILLNILDRRNKIIKSKNLLYATICLNVFYVTFGMVESENVPTIVSDELAYLEKMQYVNDSFSAQVVFAKNVLNSLGQNFSFDFRYLAEFDGVSIYESLMPYKFVVKKKMKKCKNDFESAVHFFQNGEYKLAREEFSKILKFIPADKTTYAYFNKSAEKISDAI